MSVHCGRLHLRTAASTTEALGVRRQAVFTLQFRRRRRKEHVFCRRAVSLSKEVGCLAVAACAETWKVPIRYQARVAGHFGTRRHLPLRFVSPLSSTVLPYYYRGGGVLLRTEYRTSIGFFSPTA